MRTLGSWTHRGESARARILDAAVEIAAKDGIHRVTFGRVAKAAKVSKSTVFEHYGPIDELRLAVVDRAANTFEWHVTFPARQVRTGVTALYTLLHRWLAYATERSYVGGCFLTSVTAEFEGCVGAVHDGIAALCVSWVTAMEWEIQVCQTLGQISPSENKEQLAFQLHAPILEAGWSLRYLRREDAYNRALEAIRDVMGRVLTPTGRREIAEVEAEEQRWLERSRRAPQQHQDDVDWATLVEQFPLLGRSLFDL